MVVVVIWPRVRDAHPIKIHGYLLRGSKFRATDYRMLEQGDRIF